MQKKICLFITCWKYYKKLQKLQISKKLFYSTILFSRNLDAPIKSLGTSRYEKFKEFSKEALGAECL